MGDDKRGLRQAWLTEVLILLALKKKNRNHLIPSHLKDV